jgi:hypothetical protein
MALPVESCQDCGKVMKGRAIPRVWDGQRVVCSACYRTLATNGKQEEEEQSSQMVSGLVEVTDSDVLSEIVKLAQDGGWSASRTRSRGSGRGRRGALSRTGCRRARRA